MVVLLWYEQMPSSIWVGNSYWATLKWSRPSDTMNRLAVYSYLTRYISAHAESGSFHRISARKELPIYRCTLNPATWLSFLYHTAFYEVPYNSRKNNLFCLAILSIIGTLYFKAYAPKLVMYVCLFYFISRYVILLDSLHHRIPICFV